MAGRSIETDNLKRHILNQVSARSMLINKWLFTGHICVLLWMVEHEVFFVNAGYSNCASMQTHSRACTAAQEIHGCQNYEVMYVYLKN